MKMGDNEEGDEPVEMIMLLDKKVSDIYVMSSKGHAFLGVDI